MTSEFYLSRFRELARERSWSDDTTPAELLDRWSSLVTGAERGYRWTLEEYDNKLSARDLLEAVFSDHVLKDDPDVEELRNRVAELDDRFRSLFQESVQVGRVDDPWWRRGVLRVAGLEYVEDMERIYGVSVESI